MVYSIITEEITSMVCVYISELGITSAPWQEDFRNLTEGHMKIGQEGGNIGQDESSQIGKIPILSSKFNGVKR